MQLTIGITDTEARYSNYPSWITAAGSHIEVIQLKAENSRGAEKCDGIVLSGGIDIHPKFYNKQCLTYPYAPEKFNEQRDEFELAVFRYARDKCLPVLAICRGMQLVNIALGGTLIQDIEASGKNDHRRHGQTDGEHAITVIKDSLLYEITGSETGHINSAHHQALGIVAQELKVNAYSPDGIAEGTEWKNKTQKPFLLCVQWHPERLAQLQPDHPFANNILKQFIEAVKNNKDLH